MLVAKGDLDTHKSRQDASGKRWIDDYLAAGKPYVVIRGLPDNPASLMLGGAQNRQQPIDAVFLQHGLNGIAPFEQALTQLYWQGMRLKNAVDELLLGVPLTQPLELLSFRSPEAEFQQPLTLTATVRYLARWRLNL